MMPALPLLMQQVPEVRQTCTPSSPRYKWFLRELVAVGSVPTLPADDNAANSSVTVEIGAYPLGQILSTGVSGAFTWDLKGDWRIWSLGLFGQINVTSLLLSGLWTYPYDPRQVPFRLDLGARLGLDASESHRAGVNATSDAYQLIRPEVQSFLDLGFPFGVTRRYTAVMRAAVDTSVNLGTVFRWSGSIGLEVAFGRGPI